MAQIHIKRVYDPPSPDDGIRVLIDRLWPRGLTREAARIERWVKDAAPSAELRRWFGHAPARWPEFQRRYRAELAERSETLQDLRALAQGGKILTLVFAAKDTEHNNAVVLQQLLR